MADGHGSWQNKRPAKELKATTQRQKQNLCEIEYVLNAHALRMKTQLRSIPIKMENRSFGECKIQLHHFENNNNQKKAKEKKKKRNRTSHK